MTRRIPQSEIRKPLKEELDERVDMCRRLLGKGMYDGEVKRAVAAHYNISPRTVERYLRRARRIICAETGKTVEEHRADAYAVYRELQRSDKEFMRLKATMEIVDLVGAAAPSTVRLTGANGGAIEHRLKIVRIIRPVEAKPLNEQGFIERVTNALPSPN